MEAFAIVIVAAVAALIFVVTWFGVRNDGGRNPIAGRAQLEAYRRALLEKTRRAEQERWDDTMVERLVQELEMVDRRLAEMERRAA